MDTHRRKIPSGSDNGISIIRSIEFYMTIPNWLKEVQDSLGFHGGVASKIAGVADTYRRKAWQGPGGQKPGALGSKVNGIYGFEYSLVMTVTVCY